MESLFSTISKTSLSFKTCRRKGAEALLSRRSPGAVRKFPFPLPNVRWSVALLKTLHPKREHVVGRTHKNGEDQKRRPGKDDGGRVRLVAKFIRCRSTDHGNLRAGPVDGI